MQPNDYTLNMQNPLQSFQDSYILGSTIQKQREAAMDAEQARTQARIQAEEDAKRQQQLMAAYDKLRDPSARARDYENLAMMLPKDQAETLLNIAKNRTEEENRADLIDSMSVFNSFNSGLPEMGISLLRKHAEAEKEVGNAEGAKTFEEYAKLAESGEEGAKAIENLIGLTIIALPGGKDALDASSKYNDERRKEKEHPILVQQKKAELSKASSEAEKSAIEAKYAEKAKVLDLKKTATDMGLTEEQTKEAVARAKKLDAETAKLLMELDALKNTGGIPPEKKFEQEEKIRGEYTKRVSNYNEMRQTYANIQASASDESGAGDVALVTGFMKMLDPGSVVRESEFATARDTSGLYGSLVSLSSKVKNGQFLTPQQRKDFASLAGKYMEASQGYEGKVRKDLTNVVESYGLSPTNVFGTIANAPEIKRPTAPKNNPGFELSNIEKQKYPTREVDY